MLNTKWWLVCYDVRDDKRLRKCAKHMEGYGHRLQYSVFRCWLSPLQMERLRWDLTKKLAVEDEVLFSPLCERCVSGIAGIYARERPTDWADQPPRHTVM